MPRAIWKGAISFGLVHVPVALYPASQEAGIDFDWIDKRTMDPVGYLRINKRTGKEIQKENVVKGIRQEDDEYVVISDNEIKAAFPKSTQTIEIEAFVRATEIPFILLERPYYLEPSGKGDKVYALLRDSMLKAGVIGIARVVLHTKEHLAALIPSQTALVLNTIRWSHEIRPIDELKLPAGGKTAQPKPAELKMAAQLIADMTTTWNADDYADTFTEAVHQLVAQKIKVGETEKVTAPADKPSGPASNVVDLTELLAKSLERSKPPAASKEARHKASSKPAKTAAPMRTAATKRT